MNVHHAGRLGAATLAILVVVANAHADEGMVIWKNHDCGFFILQEKSGYGLYQWLAGPHPNDGDVIEGEIKIVGEHKVNNKTADVPTTVLVDAFAAKRAELIPRLPARCKEKPGDPPPDSQ